MTGSATPACTTGAVPGDPSWPARSTYPAVVTSVPACSSRWPGSTRAPTCPVPPCSVCSTARTLSSGSRPGVYYFDFRDATRSWWRATATSSSAGRRPAGSPAPRRRARPDTQRGEPRRECLRREPARRRLRLRRRQPLVTCAPAAACQLCAERTGSASQHVVLRGLATPSAALAVAVPSAGAATRAAQSGTWHEVAPAARGAVVNGRSARVAFPAPVARGSVRIGPFPADLVPPEATGISVTSPRRQPHGPGTSRAASPTAARPCSARGRPCAGSG